MSLIEKALERAKEMEKARVGRARKPELDARASRTAVDGKAAAPASILPERASRANFAPLAHVEFDASACVRNHVLVDEVQLAAAGRAAASYRMLRSRLGQRLKGKTAPCVGITSAGPGDGKSLTSLNLAIHVARERQLDVYLLDLDMRNPSLFASVGCVPPRELAEFLQGKCKPEDVLFGTPVDQLVITGVSSPVHGASELLASPRLDELLDHIRQRSPNSVILCDLPPVLSTDEALVVAPRTDCIVLVVGEGVTRRDALGRAIEMLSDFKVAGVVLNRSSEDVGTDYYGYYSY